MKAQAFLQFKNPKVAFWKMFSILLCLSTVDVQAQPDRFSLVQTPTEHTRPDTSNMPDMRPQDIAADVQITVDNQTGQTGISAPTFDPFEDVEGLAGMAHLRSFTSSPNIKKISREGHVISGGALLEITILYTSTSNDPLYNLGFEKALFDDSTVIDSLRYESTIVECSEQINHVSYEDDYYKGARQGRIAGLYRTYPYYRGYHLYGYNHTRTPYTQYGHAPLHRPHYGHYSGFSYGGFNYSGYGYYGGFSYGPFRHGYYTTHGLTSRTRHHPNSHPSFTPTSPASPRTNSQTGRRYNRSNAPAFFVDRPRTQTNSTRPQAARPLADQPRLEVGPTPSAEQTNQTTAPTPIIQRSRRTLRRPFHNRRRFQNRNQTRRHADKKPQPNASAETHNFFPAHNSDSNRTQHYTQNKCAREETLILHIPQTRLETAPETDLHIILLSHEAPDTNLYIPANYLQGYLQGYLQAHQAIHP